MALIQGAVGSNSWTASAPFIDGEGKIYLNKKRADMPLLSFLGMNGRKYELMADGTGGVKSVQGKALSKRKVENPKFRIFTDSVGDFITSVNLVAGYSSSDVSIVVLDATVFTPFDLIYAPRTGERMMVSASNTTTNTITVVRGWGSTAAALINGEALVMIAPAYPVNSLSGTAKTTAVAEDYNYTQIFRTPVAEGRTDMDTRLNYTNGSDWERLKMQAALDHLRKQERAFWYGVRNETTSVDSSGARERTTGGVFQFVTSNVMDLSAVGGVMTQNVVDSFAEMAFGYGSGEKIAFCSPRVLSRLNSLTSNLVRISNDDTKFGQNIYKWVTSHGEMTLVRTPHFAEPGLANIYGGAMVLLDPEQIKMAYLQNAENEYHDNIQENDRDGRKAEWLAEAGLHISNEKSHAILLGVV